LHEPPVLGVFCYRDMGDLIVIDINHLLAILFVPLPPINASKVRLQKQGCKG